jgi:hypothetical protein
MLLRLVVPNTPCTESSITFLVSEPAILESSLLDQLSAETQVILRAHEVAPEQGICGLE